MLLFVSGLQQGEGSNVWHWDTAWQRRVWPQSSSLFTAVWERECFLFIRGRAEALQETAFLYDLFIGKTTCWKWCVVIAILTLLPLIYPTCISVALIPPVFFLSVFLHELLIYVKLKRFMRDYSKLKKCAKCFIGLKQNKDKGKCSKSR